MELLPMAQLELNGCPNSEIGGLNPFFLRYRYEMDPLMDPISTGDKTMLHPEKIAAENYIQRLKDTQDFTQAIITSAQQRNEFSGNRCGRQPEKFSVGDKAWLDLRNIKASQVSIKLSWQHTKYTVAAVSDPLTVELDIPDNK